MLTWKYEAVDKSGGNVTGELDAPTVPKAVQLILKRGEFPTKIWCVNPQPASVESNKPAEPIRIYSR
jgi:hypothetical protein